MKKILSIVFLSATSLAMSYSQEKSFLSDIWSYLDNTSVYELNQEEGHVPLVPYATVDDALKNLPEGSTAYLSLMVSGNFIIQTLLKVFLQKFYKSGFDDKKWDTIDVPLTGK